LAGARRPPALHAAADRGAMTAALVASYGNSHRCNGGSQGEFAMWMAADSGMDLPWLAGVRRGDTKAKNWAGCERHEIHAGKHGLKAPLLGTAGLSTMA